MGSYYSIEGIAFLGKRLFITTDIGLLEVQNFDVKYFYQWNDINNNVLSGPWIDPLNNTIWFQRSIGDKNLIRLDSSDGWHLVPLPLPPNGYYSRGDFLRSFSGIGSDFFNFHLIGAGNVWKRVTDNWIIKSSPPTKESDGVVGYAKDGNRDVYIVRLRPCVTLPCTYTVYSYESSHWLRLSPIVLPVGNIEQVITASNGIFIRGGNGELLQIKNNMVVELDTPAYCESIAQTTKGKLIATFRRTGIYILDGVFIKVLDIPKDNHWIYLAENNGNIAFAATDALWIFDGKYSTQIILPK